MSKVFVYVDETGDRGASAVSSPIFGMAAVVVREEDAPELRASVQALREDFRVPINRVMSWKEDVKTHDRRRRAVQVLGSVRGARVSYVYAQKAMLKPGSYRDDTTRFYNYLAYKTFKSALWSARNMGGDEVHLRFGHVRHHDHTTTAAYIRSEAARESTVPEHLVGSLRWVSADQFAESQAADLYGGFLKSATWPTGPFSFVEPAYLLQAWPGLRNSEKCAIPLGIMAMPDYSVLTDEEWFPCLQCTK